MLGRKSKRWRREESQCCCGSVFNRSVRRQLIDSIDDRAGGRTQPWKVNECGGVPSRNYIKGAIDIAITDRNRCEPGDNKKPACMVSMKSNNRLSYRHNTKPQISSA
jgi:hypothetical protein